MGPLSEVTGEIMVEVPIHGEVTGEVTSEVVGVVAGADEGDAEGGAGDVGTERRAVMQRLRRPAHPGRVAGTGAIPGPDPAA
jgi:hypothetical protein